MTWVTEILGSQGHRLSVWGGEGWGVWDFWGQGGWWAVATTRREPSQCGIDTDITGAL